MARHDLGRAPAPRIIRSAEVDLVGAPTDEVVPRHRLIKARAVDLTEAFELEGTRLPADAPHAPRGPAHSVSRAELEAAVDAAWQAGYDEAHAEAATAAQAALPRVGEAIESLRAQLASSVQAQVAADAAAVVDAAIAIAAWVLRREIDAAPAAAIDRVRDALGQLPPALPIRIVVAPSQVALVTEALAEDAHAHDEITVRPDRSLEPGEARLTCGETTIDATFAEAFGRVRTELLGEELS